MAPPRMPGRGEHDEKPTPSDVYAAITGTLGFRDACLDPRKYDFLRARPRERERLYCNPPFSRKAAFVEAACRHAERGASVILYLPADFTTRWFRHAIRCGAVPIVLTRRVGRHGRWPAMLLVFNYDWLEVARALGAREVRPAWVALE